MTADPGRLGGWARIGVAALAVLSAGCVVRVEGDKVTAVEERRFTVGDSPDVSLETFDGPVEVRTWDRSEVFVRIEKTASSKEALEAMAVRQEADLNRVRVEVVEGPAPGGFIRVGFGRSARIQATIPSSCSLTVRSGDGPIAVEETSGRIDLRTADGPVKVLRVSGDVFVDTDDGPIHLDDVDGRVRARSGDGAVFARGVLKIVNIRTLDGSITVTAQPGSEAADAWELATGDGNVALDLPDTFAASIDAETADGTVRSDLQLTMAAQSHGSEPDRGDRRRLRGTLNEGGPTLRIRTDEGTISLRRH